MRSLRRLPPLCEQLSTLRERLQEEHQEGALDAERQCKE
jgi:hypothetical protein